MNKKEVLVVEISGKRPGNYKDRPTEKYKCDYDHLIISNNSEGYETDWNIINVPKDYEEWYKANCMVDEKAYYAPMNRSYAIKYAREHGYKYLVQLDDNIISLRIQYKIGDKIIRGKNNADNILNDYIKALVLALESTNAGMSGCDMLGASMPSQNYLRERYCYSIFCLKLDVCPDYFQGGFEDDVEYRLKLMQKGIPTIQIVPLNYGKTGQGNNKDLTGCRKAYADVGVLRGSNMSKLYGNLYKAGTTNKDHSLGNSIKRDYKVFKHKLKVFKLGIRIINKEKKKELDNHIKYMFSKYIEVKK